MKGNYQCGFFDMVEENDSKTNWHKLSYYKQLHDPVATHCRLCMIGDYCMFYK